MSLFFTEFEIGFQLSSTLKSVLSAFCLFVVFVMFHVVLISQSYVSTSTLGTVLCVFSLFIVLRVDLTSPFQLMLTDFLLYSNCFWVKSQVFYRMNESKKHDRKTQFDLSTGSAELSQLIYTQYEKSLKPHIAWFP